MRVRSMSKAAVASPVGSSECPCEESAERTRLIGEITRLLTEPEMPAHTRDAGLTLIGWLARRMPGEPAHAIGVKEARASQCRLRVSRKAR